MEAQPIIVFQKHIDTVAALGRWQIEDLELAIYLRRLHMAADELTGRGFAARVVPMPGEPDKGTVHVFNMVLVGPPAGAESELAEWADLAQCRRLIDIVANMPPAEAFDRWVQGLPLPEPYTQWDARRDAEGFIRDAHQAYAGGKINGQTLGTEIRAARSFADAVEPADRNAHLRTIPQLAAEWGVSIRRAQAHVKYLHAKYGAGRKLGNAWVLTDVEAVEHKPADGPGRPHNE